MEKLKINLDVLLPEVPDERDACVQRIITMLQRRPGVEKAHVLPPEAGRPAQLCFHFNPDVISLQEIRQVAMQAGAALTQQYGHLLAELEGIRDMNEATAIEQRLRRSRGVMDASLSAAGPLRLEYDRKQTTAADIRKEILRQHVTITAFSDMPQGAGEPAEEAAHDHDHDHGHSHGRRIGEGKGREYTAVGISLGMLLLGLAADFFIKPAFFTGWLRFAWYLAAYLPAGWPVASKGLRLLLKGDLFTEFILMTLATVGAFFIKEYPEGVAVMVFYTIGELFQDAAVNRARRSIKALLDIRPQTASVQRNGAFTEVSPKEVQPGEVIQVKAGERVPLDGALLSAAGTFNTAALTGESRPQDLETGGAVLAGMINQGKVVEVKVTKLYNDSSLARILTLVQEATTRKARTEQFIRRFSRIYTPAVVFIAAGIAVLPYFFTETYVFRDWLYRALVFLVISCPCALVISIPLGYFGGIGAASRNGILFKGSSYLDLMTKVNAVVMDKTGTLTKGVFRVQQVKDLALPAEEWLPMAAALESGSTHPVAQAVVEYAAGKGPAPKADELEEISGHGIKGMVNGKEVLAGNAKLMNRMKVSLDGVLEQVTDTVVLVAVNGQLAGYLTIADEIKEDSREAVGALQQKGITTIMLSGDKQAVVDAVARELGIDKAYGDLLPEQKVEKVQAVKAEGGRVVAFVGDGINDAPVLAISDVGMAMGGLGSDAAIETADVIIQTDQPSKIAKAIAIGRATNRIVWQNIGFAFAIKIIVMILGAEGIATMWEAVFADVGVALLAILNAARIQRMKF